MSGSANATVLWAVETPRAGVRAVVQLDDDTITLAERRAPRADDRPGDDAANGLFRPVSVADITDFAVRCIRGDAVALTHPKAALVLASGFLAILAVFEEEQDNGL